MAASTGSPKVLHLIACNIFVSLVLFPPFFSTSLSIRSWNLSPAFFHILPSPFIPNFRANWNRSMVGGPPTRTGFPVDVMILSSAVGAIRQLFALYVFPLRGSGGTPTRLHESAGWNCVEQGPPSARTMELPIHISASALPATVGRRCSNSPGRCTMLIPACAIHCPCTLTDGAIPLAKLQITAPGPLSGLGRAGATTDMMAAVRSKIIPTCGTGQIGSGQGKTIG